MEYNFDIVDINSLAEEEFDDMPGATTMIVCGTCS